MWRVWLQLHRTVNLSAAGAGPTETGLGCGARARLYATSTVTRLPYRIDLVQPSTLRPFELEIQIETSNSTTSSFDFPSLLIS